MCSNMLYIYVVEDDKMSLLCYFGVSLCPLTGSEVKYETRSQAADYSSELKCCDEVVIGQMSCWRKA